MLNPQHQFGIPARGQRKTSKFEIDRIDPSFRAYAWPNMPGAAIWTKWSKHMLSQLSSAIPPIPNSEVNHQKLHGKWETQSFASLFWAILKCFFCCLVASFFGRVGILGRKFTHGDQNIMAWKRYFISDNHEMLWVSRYPSEISGVYSPRLAMVMVISSEKDSGSTIINRNPGMIMVFGAKSDGVWGSKSLQTPFGRLGLC